MIREEPYASSSAPEVLSSSPQPDNEAQAKARALVRQKTSAFEADSPMLAAAPLPDNDAQAKSRETIRKDMPAPAPQIVTAPAGKKAPSQPAVWTAGMQPPALPITPEQQQQLDELLQQYRADRISASEYHTRRAQIIGTK